MTQVPDFHDATIKSIHVEWEEARCSVELKTWERPVHLIFSGVRLVLVPREEPWGPSVSVNALRGLGDEKFEIELQSGDVVQIHAAHLQIT